MWKACFLANSMRPHSFSRISIVCRFVGLGELISHLCYAPALECLVFGLSVLRFQMVRYNLARFLNSSPPHHQRVVDVRGRSDFSRFDPRPEPTLATLLAPRSEDLFAEAPVGAGWGPRAARLATGSQVTAFSRFGAHLIPDHV